jgi:hypothetical protein
VSYSQTFSDSLCVGFNATYGSIELCVSLVTWVFGTCPQSVRYVSCLTCSKGMSRRGFIDWWCLL